MPADVSWAVVHRELLICFCRSCDQEPSCFFKVKTQGSNFTPNSFFLRSGQFAVLMLKVADFTQVEMLLLFCSPEFLGDPLRTHRKSTKI